MTKIEEHFSWWILIFDKRERNSCKNDEKSKMVVHTEDNICTERVCKREFGYVEVFFLHFSEKFNATLVIRNPYAHVEY